MFNTICFKRYFQPTVRLCIILHIFISEYFGRRDMRKCIKFILITDIILFITDVILAFYSNILTSEIWLILLPFVYYFMLKLYSNKGDNYNNLMILISLIGLILALLLGVILINEIFHVLDNINLSLISIAISLIAVIISFRFMVKWQKDNKNK